MISPTRSDPNDNSMPKKLQSGFKFTQDEVLIKDEMIIVVIQIASR